MNKSYRKEYMLEYIEFIALIAIVFGISFTQALDGFLKFSVIAGAVVLALVLISNLAKTKTGAIFVTMVSIVAVVYGALLINDNQDSRIHICDYSIGSSYYTSCALDAIKKHDSVVNTGWGIVIVGGFFGIVSGILWQGYSETEKRNKILKPHSEV